MPALTPQYLMDLESRMQVISENGYAELTSQLWYKLITKQRTTTSRREVLLWLLSTAQIRDEGEGGNIHFEDLVSQYTEVEVGASGAGLKFERNQLEDTDGKGVELASSWSRDMGVYMQYYPQKQAARFLKEAHTPVFTAYDKRPFFAVDHPINPYKTSAGGFANLFTGAELLPANNNGVWYPGALPIDRSVSIDQAIDNLAKLQSYVSGIKVPNGEDPRHLRLEALIVPPRLFPRATEITQAKFIARAVGNAGVGTTDVEALIKALGYATPTQADELAGFENDTTYYAVARQVASNELGAVLWTEREAYHIDYYGPVDDAVLSRAQELEWHCRGRNRISAGHPFLLFKIKGA